jgi:hypothetical protein
LNPSHQAIFSNRIPSGHITDFSMWLGLLFLLIVGAGKKWSLDTTITSKAAALVGPAIEEGPLGTGDDGGDVRSH